MQMSFRLMVLTAMLAAPTVVAETLVHHVNGYTSTRSGLHAFSTLVFSDDGKVVATGDESLLSDYHDAVRIDGQVMDLGIIDQ